MESTRGSWTRLVVVTALVGTTALCWSARVAAQQPAPRVDARPAGVAVAPRVEIRVVTPAVRDAARIHAAVERRVGVEARGVLKAEFRALERLREDWLRRPGPVPRDGGLVEGITEWTPKLGVLVGALAKVGATLLVTWLDLVGLA